MGKRTALTMLIPIAVLLVLAALGCNLSVDLGRRGATPATETVISATIVSATTAPPTKMPTQPPQRVSAWPLVLADDFDDPESGFGERSDENRRRSYQDGRYNMELLSEDWISWASVGSFSDFVMEVDVISEGEAGYAGLVFRKEGDYQFYFFSISTEGRYRLRKWLAQGEENWETILDWRRSPHIRTGEATNRLRTVCVGSQIWLYVNDQYLDTVQDTTFSEGELGMASATLPGESYARFSFDNLRVFASTPAVEPTTTPSPRQASVDNALAIIEDLTQYSPRIFGSGTATDEPIGGVYDAAMYIKQKLESYGLETWVEEFTTQDDFSWQFDAWQYSGYSLIIDYDGALATTGDQIDLTEQSTPFLYGWWIDDPYDLTLLDMETTGTVRHDVDGNLVLSSPAPNTWEEDFTTPFPTMAKASASLTMLPLE